MRALVICDDYWHHADVPRAGLGALGDGAFAFDWIEDAKEWSAERMAPYPLVVLVKSNNVSSTDREPWVDDAVEQAFLEYVRSGKGLLAIHSGTASYQDRPVLRGLLGGVFLRHPPQCDVTVTPKEGHPLVAGATAFTVKDEHYLMALDDETADVFLTTASEHGTEPGGWTRTEGEGRVCVLTPGHNVEVWLHPSFQALLRNALRWCAAKE
ncbi:MAG TPA: ThuA domain-containing protein [Chloroflexi bacterium]|jgi:type 1 glutamine amidotransferase|nr:ThuA domain-containing protein [Chloroflexota bacterium]